MTDQPMPTPNDHPSIQGLVRADLEQREQVGIQRYGTPLQPHNGRDALRDAYEEALDLACYLRQAIEERHPATVDWRANYQSLERDYQATARQWAKSRADLTATIDQLRATTPALDRLTQGLIGRDVYVGADPVTTALAEIDRIAELRAQGAALAAQGDALAHALAQHLGLTAGQEIRARALTEATNLIHGIDLDDDDLTIRDAEQTTIGVAERYTDWITTGLYDHLTDELTLDELTTCGPDVPCTCPPTLGDEPTGQRHTHDAPWGCTTCECRHYPPSQPTTA